MKIEDLLKKDLAEKPGANLHAELKEATLSENMISGAAAVIGNMDRGRDVIFPKFFSGSLKQFLADGFVAVGHDYYDMPVAMPVKAAERGNALYTEALFHSTAKAQDARTVCAERMEKGLSVGLSVGFRPDYGVDDDGQCKGVKWFESGADMLKWAEGAGYDLSDFDAKGIRACKSYCRALIKCMELFEFSIVPVPMNPRAQAMAVKGLLQPNSANDVQTERDFERFLRDAGYSRKEATAITLHGYKGISLQRDADDDSEADDDAPEAKQAQPDDAERHERLRMLKARTNALRMASAGRK